MKKLCACLSLGLVLGNPLVAAPDEFSSTTISVGVVVSDLDESLSFYTDVVGMIRTGSFDVAEEFAKKSGLSNGVPLHVEVLRLGEGEQATQWKLMTFGNRAKKQQNEFIQATFERELAKLQEHLREPIRKARETPEK